MIAVPLVAETLTPLAYHSLMVQGGSATLPELLGDNALNFALAAALGKCWRSVALPEKDYRCDLSRLPWRFSVFLTDEPRLLPPIAKRLNLDAEAGFPKKIQDVAKKGNVKDYWTIQEIPPGQCFYGAIFGFDPFAETGREEIVVRVGLHRSGMVRLKRSEEERRVRLNAWTAKLFGRELPVERFLLYPLQLTPEMSLKEAAEEVSRWR